MPEITLSKLTRSDLADFFEWAGDPEVTKSLFWDAYPDLASAEKFMIEKGEKHPWLMAIRVDGRARGAISLDPGQGKAAHRAELGYVVARSEWGKGLATRAVKLTLARGFADLGIERIDAFVDPANEGSIRVLENGGLVREAELSRYVIHRGKIRDRYLYVALKEGTK